MALCFVLLANGAGFDVFLDFFDHARPPEIPPYEFRCFVHAEMSRDLGVVFGLEDAWH